MFPAFPPLFPALLAALPTGPGAAALVATAAIKQKDTHFV